jgi:hypothetical protein
MAHRWRFSRSGGVDQVRLETGADLAALEQLDQKLWVALSCPVEGLAFDERTLALIDADGDGRIRAGELIDAVRWTVERLRDVEVLADGSESLPLSAIDTTREEGKLVHDTAKALLRSIGKADATSITVADAVAAVKAFAEQPANGDGIVPAEAANDEEIAALIRDILKTMDTPERDRSGRPGVSRAAVDAFFEAIVAHAAWLERGRSETRLRPLGDDSLEACATLEAVRAKIDDYFTRCRVAAYDARALVAFDRHAEECLQRMAKNLGGTAQELTEWPIAHLTPEALLPLGKGANPAWRDRLEAFRAKVVVPLLGARDTLTEQEWLGVLETFAPLRAHLAEVAGKSVQPLGAERIAELARLAKSDLRTRLEALIAEDQRAEPFAKAADSVERLVRYARDLFELANNFVCFRDFYARTRPAMFQAGTLYIDARACELCVQVTDPTKNAAMAPLSGIYLLYCDCKNALGETRRIAAAVTGGDVDNLMVGRNGVFYDRAGGAWDATVTRIVEQPISIRQAFWAPYKKALRLVEEQVARRVGEAEAAASTRMSSTVETTSEAVVPGGPAAAPAVARGPAAPRKLDIGVVAAIGVAVGGITAALGALLQAFFGLGIWMPLGILGLMLAISGPSMAIAALKLRKRNLGPLLDANGWAVNAQARINVPLGASLTLLATLPPGAERDLTDRYATKKHPWWLYLTLVALLAAGVAWYLGKLDPHLPNAARSTRVLGAHAPAARRTASPDDRRAPTTDDAPAVP